MLRAKIVEKDKRLLNAVEQFKNTPDINSLLQQLNLILGKSSLTELSVSKISDEKIKGNKDLDFNSPSEVIEESRTATNYFLLKPAHNLSTSSHKAEKDLKALLIDSKNFLSNPHRNELMGIKTSHGKSLSPNLLKEGNTTPSKGIEKESPKFLSMFEIEEQTVDHSKDDSLPSARTEDILKDYLKKDTKQKKTCSLILKISYMSYLRYIRLKNLLYNLEKVSDLITVKDFIRVIKSLAEDKGFKGNHYRKEEIISRVFDTINSHKAKALSIRELAGGLSILCSGTMHERIKVALVYIGAKRNLITIDIAFQFLLSLYKVILLESPSLVKNGNITPHELAKITASQCFAYYRKSDRISIEEFVQWFPSHVKTLVPQCESKVHSKQIKPILKHKMSNSIGSHYCLPSETSIKRSNQDNFDNNKAPLQYLFIKGDERQEGIQRSYYTAFSKSIY